MTVTTIPTLPSEPALGRIAQVEPGSPAARAGLRVDDVLVAIDGLHVRDVIDYRYQTVPAMVEVDVRRGAEWISARIEKEADEDLGLEFDRPVFEGIRECNNHCEFCFIRGLPKGLRPSLYVFDDDYRYSFLFGNFLTLTNLDERDWERIAFQKLSPLYVSVHATDAEVRRRLLVNRRAPEILPQLERLGGYGIEVNCQIVLCAGINDGPVLERSLSELSQRYPTVRSVAVVPVGLTSHSRAPNIRRPSQAEAGAALDLIAACARRMRRQHGVGFAYGSDELHLLAGRPLPSARAYDHFPQLQNGVGLIRLMLVAWEKIRRRIPTALSRPRRVGWLCGRAIQPALIQIEAELRSVEGLEVEVVGVENTLFGEGVTVSGLMAGRDMLDVLRGHEWDLAVLPRAAFGFEGQQTLDGVTVEELQAAVPYAVEAAGSAEELLSLTVG